MLISDLGTLVNAQLLPHFLVKCLFFEEKFKKYNKKSIESKKIIKKHRNVCRRDYTRKQLNGV